MGIAASKRVVFAAVTLLAVTWLLYLTPRAALLDKTMCLLDSSSRPSRNASHATTTTTTTTGTTPLRFGEIKDRVAMITDTQYTSRLIPLILHFHAVLGPEWPIVFYTSNETYAAHLSPSLPSVSAIWRRALEDRRVEVRIIPAEFDLKHRQGVNIYLSRPWLWEQLAPATHVLVFQADSMLCGNARARVDDFFEWDWIAATLHGSRHLYNGGLSLRNRTMLLDILREGNNWEEETASGAWTMGGEDVWFSAKMDERSAHLPDQKTALKFAVQHEWHVQIEKNPLGYHKVHKNVPNRMKEIEQWCPEITLAQPGILEPST